MIHRPLVEHVGCVVLERHHNAYMIGGSVLATAFVMYYCYLACSDSRPEPVLEPAPAR
jgi:hypothetical protein